MNNQYKQTLDKISFILKQLGDPEGQLKAIYDEIMNLKFDNQIRQSKMEQPISFLEENEYMGVIHKINKQESIIIVKGDSVQNVRRILERKMFNNEINDFEDFSETFKIIEIKKI